MTPDNAAAMAYTDDDPLIEALQHPLRRAVLAYLQEHRTGTAAEITETLGAAPTTTRHHLRRLVALGLIEPIRETPARRTTRLVYQPTTAFRDAIVALLSTEIVQLAAIAYPDIGPSAIAVLDDQALGELSHDLEHIYARVHELGAQTAARASRSRRPLPTVSIAVLFAVGHARR